MNSKKLIGQPVAECGGLTTILIVGGLLVLLLFSLPGTTYSQPQEENRYKIALKSRSFTPEPGIKAELQESLAAPLELGELRRVIIQFAELPDVATRQQLAAKGVRLLSYINGNAYFAAVYQPDVLGFQTLEAREDETLSRVRWIGQIEAADRVEPNVLAGKFGEWAINEDGTVKIRVSFFKDVDPTTQEEMLSRYSQKFNQHSPGIWQLSIERDKIKSLVKEEVVKWIEQEPPPYQPLNDVTRNGIDVDIVQDFDPSAATYNGYSGNGIQVMVRDSGIDDHDDFQGRLLASNPVTLSHGTHVAGTLGGDGSHSVSKGGTPYQWRGMAPEVEFAGYYFGWDANTYTSAMTNYGVDISNHSHTQTHKMIYNSDPETVDKIVRNNKLYIVAAAGNNGKDPNNGSSLVGYFSLTGTVAKNALSIGNYNLASGIRWQSSSMGPTFDGRLKPDIVAPGRNITSTIPNNNYGSGTGTSMASPCVAGVVALMLEAFWDSYGANAPRPLFSTMKAILIETARDLIQASNMLGEPDCPDFIGPNAQPPFFHAGPDWGTGYGLIDAEAAVAMIKDRSLFVEGEISNIGDIREHRIDVPPGTSELKVTLVWDDYPGSILTPNTSPKLVNDLNLKLIEPDGTTEHLPWVLRSLDPADDGNISPADIVAAAPGEDHINNVEQVQVKNPVSGTWIVRVDETGLPEPPQSYSLAYNFASAPVPPPLLRYSFSIHTGYAIPAGSFGNSYNRGRNLILDVDYHITPQLSILGIFGYNRFKSNVAGLDDTYWLNFSANIKYRINPGNYSPYIAGGLGFYIPESGDSDWGGNLGFGLDYDYSSTITLEVGADYHKVFNQDVQFWHAHAGLIFRF